MKGHPEIIKHLNAILTGELTAINQYFLHARMSKSWGYEKIAAKIYQESIEEMKHAQEIIDRILFLEGIPNLQKLGPISIGETVPEQLEADLKLEYEALPALRKAIEACIQHQDHTSRELLEKILASEEEHVDWLESQVGIIKEIGKENYLSQHIHE